MSGGDRAFRLLALAVILNGVGVVVLAMLTR